ncbi:hypothetical protein QK292_17055 [Arthrobacter sp. AL08]|uniref:hypothetical protein n=1 Tax=unclassified Arthrobacter TaxID=235627 RepID=UPI00249CE6CD|nr:MULTISPECIES: hypothetical protein [unclassified Arthrobacter]MDI3243250.1 hypothetical protein [Arthrobacter sp. AL05]MDI3279267.1 hypothetical protein [Arthrobacter sp. AL08]
MDANPVLKPKLATPALVLTSVALSVCVTYLLGAMATSWPPTMLLQATAFASLLAITTAGAIWLARLRRLRFWTAAAKEQWAHFDEAKLAHRITAEVTVLSVDSLQPTGSWITIRWNRFDHVQYAWIEALPDPLWPGAVLLISPDPAQLRPGTPWPTTYYIQASNCLAWAPPKKIRLGTPKPRLPTR